MQNVYHHFKVECFLLILCYFLCRSPKYDKNSALSSELRFRNRVARQDKMQDKIREIKRKQQEVEDKKISLPKKRRSIFISIVTGVLISAIFAYIYVKS